MTKSSIKTSLHSKIIEYMTSFTEWDESLVSELPYSWENYNGFILFSAPAFQNVIWSQAGSKLWEIVCSCLKSHSIAIKGRIINDSYRSPQAKVVYGNSNITNFLDNGIRYSWNVEKNMFCAGNITERHRVGTFDCENEVIVDLFAGIGYFTLPYLVHAKAKFVHACEWSPYAVEALRRNLKLNKVEDRCMVHEGDNREVCPKKLANRVNLGLIPSSEEFWSVASEALVNSGGILYIHNNVTSQISSNSLCDKCEKLAKSIDFAPDKNASRKVIIKHKSNLDFCYELDSNLLKWKHPEWFIFSLHISHILVSCFKESRSEEWEVGVDEVVRVKSYAPHIDHLVYTVTCKPVELVQ